MKKRYQIFISSTYKDLIEERKKGYSSNIKIVSFSYRNGNVSC